VLCDNESTLTVILALGSHLGSVTV